MLVKIIRYPQVPQSLEPSVEYNAFHSEQHLPALKEEHFIHLSGEFKVFHIDLNTKRCAGFDGDRDCPANAIAVIQHGLADCLQAVFIKDDEEAYIISEAGNTITVVSSPKQKQGNMNTHRVISPSAQNPVPPTSTTSGP